MWELMFSVHAIHRMFERGISSEDVRHVLDAGVSIESYPDDPPYAGRLVLGFVGQRPLHVVAAGNEEEGPPIVITAYEPDPWNWDATFRRRSDG
ncbi:MAG: DUF4258 domain-containing protein [bacterium]|nr:DUF4258 domain-containing protein [bacterium]